MNRLGVSAVLQTNAVLAVFVRFDENVGRDGRDGDVVEIGARLGIQLPQFGERHLDLLDRVARLAGNDRQAVVLQVFQMVGDQRLICS